jgi:hypothetical protein
LHYAANRDAVPLILVFFEAILNPVAAINIAQDPDYINCQSFPASCDTLCAHARSPYEQCGPRPPVPPVLDL